MVLAKKVSVLFAGLGSIGCRHLKNLSVACRRRGLALEADALRHAAAPLPDDISTLIRQEYVSADELPRYDLAFICNPTQRHLETMRLLDGKAAHVFVEKPVFVRPVDAVALGPFRDASRYYVACPLRHTRVFAFLREFVRANRVFAARAICSSYLPEWRPGRDYRTLYSAAADSGGVKIDLIHEFDYLFDLFGFPVRTHMVSRKLSDLEIACPDSVSFIGDYADMTVELHLDYYGRKAQRSIELYTSEDVVRCDFLKSEARFLRAERVVRLPEERNASCLREIEYFLDFALAGKANINDVVYANDVLAAIQEDSVC